MLRPLNAKFLVIKNISKKPIKLNSLSVLKANGVLFIEDHFTEEDKILFPEILIEPSQNVVIPTGLFLSDFKGIQINDRLEVSVSDFGDSYQTLSTAKMSEGESLEYMGPNLLPKQLNASIADKSFDVAIHKFSFDKTYFVDRGWNCGSCPHLFYRFGEDLKYQGEILNELPNQTKTESFVVPNGVSEIVIAELEQETTYINFIRINDREVSNDIVLREGEFHSIAVSANDKISLHGKYVLDGEMMRVFNN